MGGVTGIEIGGGGNESRAGAGGASQLTVKGVVVDSVQISARYLPNGRGSNTPDKPFTPTLATCAGMAGGKAAIASNRQWKLRMISKTVAERYQRMPAEIGTSVVCLLMASP